MASGVSPPLVRQHRQPSQTQRRGRQPVLECAQALVSKFVFEPRTWQNAVLIGGFGLFAYQCLGGIGQKIPLIKELGGWLCHQTQALDTASQTPNEIFLAHKFD